MARILPSSAALARSPSPAVSRVAGYPAQVSQPAPIPSGTVTLLFTDIQGSTRLWETEPEPMAVALRRHDEMLRATIEAAGGYVFRRG